MAYAESTIGGSIGGNYRVWINSIRTYDGSPAENFEEWRAEGGVNKLTTGNSAYNNYNNSSFNVQLGINGVSNSGNFNYNFASGTTGRVLAWGTGTTRVYRNSSGVGFGFTSRMDINLQNSPYLTSGWVTSGDAVQTKLRHATLTAISMDQGGIPAADEGPLWVEFSNPSGAAVDAFLEVVGTPGRVFTSPSGIGSRYNFPMGSITSVLQQRTPNSNTATLRIGIHDALGGDNWDYRDRTYTIKNDTGQANPDFSNFTYKDTNSTTVAVTGSDQVLVQGKSSLEVTVPVGDKATPNKNATMSSYGVAIGGYSKNSAWSNVADVVQTVGVVNDVYGQQNLSIKAIDSRGNGKTVTKNVNVIPYSSPTFFNGLEIKYSNDFDIGDGIEITLLNNTTLASISPMTVSGTDINQVSSPTGLRFDMAADTGSYSGTWTNIAFTQDPGTGLIIVDPDVLASAIETKYNTIATGLSEDPNTVRWYVLFEITDKLETQYATITIDVGRPFFRIGADGRLYYKEIEFFDTFSGKSDKYYPSVQAYSSVGSTWARSAASGYVGGWSTLIDNPGTNGNKWTIDVYMPAGVYVFVFYMIGGPAGAKIDFKVGPINLYSAFDTYASGGYTEKVCTTTSFGVLDGATYTITGTTNGRNASNTTGYMNGLLAVQCQRVGNL